MFILHGEGNNVTDPPTTVQTPPPTEHEMVALGDKFEEMWEPVDITSAYLNLPITPEDFLNNWLLANNESNESHDTTNIWEERCNEDIYDRGSTSPCPFYHSCLHNNINTPINVKEEDSSIGSEEMRRYISTTYYTSPHHIQQILTRPTSPGFYPVSPLYSMTSTAYSPASIPGHPIMPQTVHSEDADSNISYADTSSLTDTDFSLCTDGSSSEETPPTKNDNTSPESFQTARQSGSTQDSTTMEVDTNTPNPLPISRRRLFLREGAMLGACT